MRRLGVLAKILIALWFLVYAWLAFVGPIWARTGLAQAQAGTVRVLDPDEVLGSGEAGVNEAAQRLAAAGANVIVVAARQSAGSDNASSEQFLNQILVDNSIAQSFSQLQPNQILVYVAIDAQITGILFGSRWNATLDPVWERIRDEQMNPAFVAGDIPGGLVAGIDAIQTTINPPPPNRTPLYIMGAVLLLAGVGFAAFPLLRRRREAAAALATAQRKLEQTRREAGAALADLGQLVRVAEDKAQFDRVSYSAADIERLNQLQSSGVGLFRDAQTSFDGAEEQRSTNAPTSSGDIQALTQRYVDVQQQVKASIGPIREAEQLRAELDARGTPQTGQTTRLE